MRAWLFLLLLLLPEPAQAHDLWLLPPKAKPGPVTLALAQGMTFPKSSGAAKESSFERFEAVGPKGPVEVVWAGQKGKRAYVKLEAKTPGTYLVGAVTTGKTIKLDAPAFNRYLVSDGMSQVYLARSKEGTLEAPAVERYQKWVKAILRVGDGPGDPTRAFGHTLEILPLVDPASRKVGETLPVEVRFNGAALPDAMLGWDLEDDGPLPTGIARTDDKGRALIPLAKPGRIALRLTHMTQPKKKDYEWASYWSTLVFDVSE